MAKEKCFIYDENITVHKNSNGRFVVNFCDEFEVRVMPQDVMEVMNDEIPEIVATLIATVREKYQETKTKTEHIAKLTNSQINETLKQLLDEGCVAEELLQSFMQMKWHDIVKIFNSNNPKVELEQIKEKY